MPLLFLASEFPPGYGDMRGYNYMLAGALHQKTEINVLTPKSAGWKAFDGLTGLAIVRSGDESRKLTSVLSLNKNAAKLASTGKYSHILASGWETAGAAAMNISNRLNVGFSLIIAESQIKKYASKPALVRKAEAVVSKAGTIFCLSGRTADLLKGLGVHRVKAVVLEAGGDPPERAEITNDEIRRFRGTLSMDSRDKLIVSAGKLERKNAFDILIWSVYLLRQKRKNFKLLIIGGGPEEKRLKQIIADLHLEDCTAIAPMPQKLDAYLKACDLYVQLGRAEKEPVSAEPGLALLEAGYYGKPVVASKSCELSGVIGENTGIIVPPLLPVETSAAIERILSDDTLSRDMGKAHSKKIHEHYRWDIVADKVIRALKL